MSICLQLGIFSLLCVNGGLFIGTDELPQVTLFPASITPPMLANRYYTEFTITYTSREDAEMPLPPWNNAIPPQLPYTVGRGAAWYAADLGIMIENYTDFCVPIFKPNSYFPCILFNFNSTAYMISPPEYRYGPCCVYRRNWSVPHRDFMLQFADYYSGSTESLGDGVLNQTIDWWVIPQPLVGLRDHTVFGGFGFARQPMPSGYRPYTTFWYEGDEGWTQQVFFNFTDIGPQTRVLETFKLPEECHTELSCLYTP